MSENRILLSQDRCNNKSIKNYPNSDQYFILIEKELLVNIGYSVIEGQLLTQDADRYILTHSPVSGIITDIRIHFEKKYLVITPDLTQKTVVYDLQSPVYLSTDQLLERIYNAGLTDLDQDPVPVYMRIQKAIGQAHTLILNAIEPEPFVVGDTVLLKEKVKEILQTAFQLKSMIGAEKIIIAISSNPILKDIIEKYLFDHNIKVLEFPKVYPLFKDRLLIKEIYNIEIGKDELCSDHGILIFSPTIFYALYEALFYKKPVIDRVITVDGAYCLEYGNFRVKIGAAITAFMRPFSVENSYVMFSGGPLLGQDIEQEKSFTKSMNAIMIFEGKLNPIKENCVYCSSCVGICPVRLEPYKLIDFLKHQEYDKAIQEGLDVCINCNLCSYVCPSFIPIGKEILLGQQKREDHA